ncbi:hypothetical protein GQ600_17425 [Phytophthora cactorum]|nr:hypothetical protein GQ600_17425 [Phytophthora cactorum]
MKDVQGQGRDRSLEGEIRIDEAAARWYLEDNPIYWAARSGNLDILGVGSANFKQKITADSMDVVAPLATGSIDIACWLQSRFPDYNIGSGNYPVINGRLTMVFEVLLYLHAQHRYLFTFKFLKRLRGICRVSRVTHLYMYLYQNGWTRIMPIYEKFNFVKDLKARAMCDGQGT